MNKVILIGRLVRDPDVRYSQSGTVTVRFNLAVDRRFKRDGDEQTADFISCVAFGKSAEFLEKYGRKGIKFVIEGRIQTGSYTNRDNRKVYTTDVVVEHLEFAESKNAQQQSGPANTQPEPPSVPEGQMDFMDIPSDINLEVPFE